MAIWIALFALVISAAALLYSWRLQQENEKLRGRLDRYNKTLFTAENDLRFLRDEIANNNAKLQAELMQRTGTARFTPEMTTRTATLLHPQVNQVFSSFHLGGCSDCSVGPDETLAQVCAERGIAIDMLLGTLNMLVVDSSAPQGNGQVYTPKLVKLPNMTLEL